MPLSELENKKLTKELLDQMRIIDGFPIANDEEILGLSDPPYYTACPNPFIKDFIDKHGKPYDPANDDYHREPFAADISEGKNGPIYNAHSYHTKVPYKAIMRYILHFTKPGDIVFDGFCGTGMTGVAANLCQHPPSGLKEQIEDEAPDVRWGSRKAVLSELSPFATNIAYLFSKPYDSTNFEDLCWQIINEVKQECSWMYETNHIINNKTHYQTVITDGKELTNGEIKHTVWSDVFICPECAHELNYWEVTVDHEKKGVKKEFQCDHCNAILKRNNLERAFETIHDDALEKSVQKARRMPVLINYTSKGADGKRVKRYEREPNEDDLNIVTKISETKNPHWYPTNKVMFKGNKWGDTWRAGVHAGITHVHQFYTNRNLWVLSAIWEKIKKTKNKRLEFWFTSTLPWCGRENRLHIGNYFNRKGGVITSLRGTLYLASLSVETNVIYRFTLRIKSSQYGVNLIPNNKIVSTQSATDLRNIPKNSIDYIFTDPPFGSNLMYSELNFFGEAWFQVFTNNKNEAIVNKSQGKGLPEYQKLMEKCFQEQYRILKPGRWMTIVFHNSQNRVWVAIQEAFLRAGFVVADVRILDKNRGSFQQVTTTSAVKQDLVISAYKPDEDLEANFKLKGGTEDGVWAFIRHHIKHIPGYVEKDGYVEVIAERQNFLLFDRMVAFHVQRGIAVPISASEFYAGLKQRFPQRDDMYFTVEQVHEYDTKRMKAKRVEQVSLFVHDERSAIQWLRRELSRESQTYQDIQPKFLQELYKEKHEDLPELSVILEQNFLQDDEGRWYLPDSSREADLEKIREKTLLREFQEYKEAKGRLRMFRSEAVRTGFSKCWQEGDYETIIKVAEKLPTRVLQEEPTLLMYYDNAVLLKQN